MSSATGLPGKALCRLLVLLLLLAAGHSFGEPRRVLIIHSFGREFAPFTTMSSTFRTELARQSPEPVEFYESSIESARFAEIGDDSALLAYLQALFANRRLDLIVTIAEPATLFCIRNRDRFFPEIPLLAHVDHRQVDTVMAVTNATVIPVHVRIPVLVENVLEVLPNTTNVVMVLGSSPFEGYWNELCRKEFAAFTNRITFSYLNSLPLERIMERVSQLPPDSAVIYGMLAVDGAGVPYEQERALASVYAAANAPLFGTFESQLGNGIVGGRLISLENSGRQGAQVGLRLLRGEKAKDIRPPPADALRLIYDWRELRRWNISPSRLPADAEVKFRVPTIWEEHKWQLIGIHALCLGEGLLIFALTRSRRRLRRTEGELRQSEERLSLATNSAKVGIWSWNIPSGEIEATVECKRVFGFPEDQAVNFPEFLQRVHPEDRGAVQRAVDEAMKNASVYDTQYRVLLPDGQLRWVAARGRAQFLDGAAQNMLGVILDVTDRKRAEEKFRLAVEASPSAIVMVNEAGQIVLVNSQTERTFGYAREELVGQTADVLLTERHRAQYDFTMKNGSRPMDGSGELSARRKDGREFPVEIGLHPIHAEEGSFVLASVTDLSERRKTEMEIERHRQELAHVSRVWIMGELSASIAHELNQPLTAILTNTHAAQRFMASGHADMDEFREILRDIAHDTTRARDVIRHLRALVKKSQPDFARLDITDTIREVVGFLNGDIVARNVRVLLQFAPHTPAVMGDRIQLQQVMINLLMNAFDALIDNPVSERVVTVTTSFDSQAVQVTVRDRGPGIEPDRLDSVFDPFSTTKREGLGMGLSVTRSIIETHRGRVWAENNAEGGAAFHFRLAVAPSAAAN